MLSRAKPAAVLFAALLCACGGGGGGSSAAVGGPVGEPGVETEAAMQSYLEVIRGSSRFNECFGPSLLAKCERGARAGKWRFSINSRSAASASLHCRPTRW